MTDYVRGFAHGMILLIAVLAAAVFGAEMGRK